MPFFTYDDLAFHYRDEGTGLPFFFQHGLGADVTQPFGLFKPPPGVRLLAFDARAHGQTRPIGPIEKIGLATFADDLLALMDNLEIPQAIVGGISMGAAISLNLVLRHPGRVVGLVLSRPAWLDAPNPWNVKMFSLISQLLRDHGRVTGKQQFTQTREYLETLSRWPNVAASLAGQFDNPLAEESAFKFERIITNCPNHDRREWTKIAVPTLVLANQHDPIHPYEYGEVLAQLIPRAELREITSKSVSVDRHGVDVQRSLDGFLRDHFGSLLTSRLAAE
jgi:pimeloyl-ACP methyl ester carboxylesterase